MGFKSWIFVDGIDQAALYEALDLVPTGETPDHHDLGTSYVPLAGASLKSGWCAVFAKYALVMDLTIGTTPSRLLRLPAKSRSVTCVILEHAMISYARFWQDGRQIWQTRHDSSLGSEHLETSGDLPPEFAGYRDIAIDNQRTDRERLGPGEWGVDYVFDVPLDTTATLTGYRASSAVEDDFFGNLHALTPANGNALNKLIQPCPWWQVAGSMKYEQ